MPSDTNPDGIELTDPSLQLDAVTFRSTLEANSTEVEGLLLIVKEGVARALIERTIPNKGWQAVAKRFEGDAGEWAPTGYEAVLFKTGTYLVKQHADGPYLEIQVRMPAGVRAAEGSSNGFAISTRDVHLVYAYNAQKGWVAPR